MTPESLSIWADVAAIFLVMQIFVFTIFASVTLGMAWWYLRLGRKKLVVPLLMAQVYALRIQHATNRVGNKIVSVPIGINATVKRAQVTASRLLSSDKAQGN